MNEKNIIRFAILIYWTFFWGLSVVDKIIPDVQTFWVGKDFFALFIKFFASLGLKNPMTATIALASITVLEVVNFVCYLFSLIGMLTGKHHRSEKWFFRGILTSIALFSLFSIGDQVFGDRFQLLEHGLFWLILIASWFIFKHISYSENEEVKLKPKKSLRLAWIIGAVLTGITSMSILQFTDDTYDNLTAPVVGQEVVDHLYKFDFPFLADKLVWEETINQFKKEHPNLKVDYIYTGPSELNTKKKTHLLLYVFTKDK